MYCIKCGKLIADDSVACAYCGAMVDGSDNPYINSADVSTVKPVSVSSFQSSTEKSKKTGLIIAIVLLAIVLLGGAGLGYWYFTRPIMLINKAIEVNDIQTVASLFDELEDEGEILSVQRAMGKYCDSLKKDFINRDKEYDDVMDDLELLENVLKDGGKYTSVLSEVKEINESRENFEAAAKAYSKEDYEKALELFESVSKKDDENYASAQEQIEEIKKLLIPDIIGTWSADIDFGGGLLSAAELSGYDIDTSLLSKISLPIKICLTFTEDNKCYYTYDATELIENFDEYYKGPLLDIAVGIAAKAAGMSVQELSSYCEWLYGTDARGALEKEIDFDALKNELMLALQSEYDEDYYSVDKSNVYLYSTKEDMELGTDMATGIMELKDDTIRLNDNAMNIEYSLEQCFDYPVVFEKEDAE